MKDETWYIAVKYKQAKTVQIWLSLTEQFHTFNNKESHKEAVYNVFMSNQILSMFLKITSLNMKNPTYNFKLTTDRCYPPSLANPLN